MPKKLLKGSTFLKFLIIYFANDKESYSFYIFEVGAMNANNLLKRIH